MTARGTALRRLGTRRAVEIGGLLLLLAGHFSLRSSADRALALEDRSPAYRSHIYQVSLGLLADRGFARAGLADIPEALPVRRFLRLREASLDPEDLAAYYAAEDRLDSGRLTVHGVPHLEETRILDLRVAAILWELFGIRWDVLFRFYTALSTAACLFVFLLTRRLFGPAAAFTAGALFAISPLERLFLVNPIYTTPLWFSILGFFALICGTERWRRPGLRLASFVVAGAAATLGIGWRPTALVVVPFLVVVLVVRLAASRRPRWYTVAATALFLAGCLLCGSAIRLLGGRAPWQPQSGFHVAFYGNAVRSNLLAIEDSLQVFTCDREVEFQARYSAGEEPLEFAGREYGETVRGMYLEALGHDAYAWIRGFPRFYVRALRATALEDLAIFRDGRRSIAAPPEPARMPPFLTSAVRAGGRATPYLALLGIVMAVFRVGNWRMALLIAAHSVYEAAILFAVLPQYVQAASLVLPVSLLGGLGLAGAVRLARALPGAVRDRQPLVSRRRLKLGTVGAVSALTLWGLATLAARAYSSHRRAELIGRIEEAAASSVPDPAGVLSEQLFSIEMQPGDTPDPVGYLLEIQGGWQPALLSVLHRRIDPAATSWNRVHESRHRIVPGRQSLFLTCLQGWRQGDTRPYRCTVVLPGGAQIVSAARVDLEGRRGLRASTVFFDGQRAPGSPFLGARSNVSYYDPQQVDALGLQPQQRARLPDLGLERLRLIASAGSRRLSLHRLEESETGEGVAKHLLRYGDAKSTPTGSTSFRLTIPAGAHGLATPPLELAEPGYLELRASYRMETGALRLVAQGPGGQQLTSRQRLPLPGHSGWVERIYVDLEAGARFRLVLRADPAGGALAVGELYDLAFLVPRPRGRQARGMNNSPATATRLPAGATGGEGLGYIDAGLIDSDPDDVDWWSIDGAAPGYLLFAHVDDDHPLNSSEPELGVYADDGLTEIQDCDHQTTAGTVVPQAGKVYLRVSERGSTTGTVHYSAFRSLGLPFDRSAEREPNDAPGQATPITAGVMSGRVTGSDVDHYAFEVTDPSGGGILAIVDNDPDRNAGSSCAGCTRTVLDLVRADGHSIASRADRGLGKCAIAEALDVGSPGTYYLRVAAGDASGDSDYRFALLLDGRSVSPCGERLEDRMLQRAAVAARQLHQTCGSITTGPRWSVIDGGEVTLRSPRVVLGNGTAVPGGALAVENELP